MTPPPMTTTRARSGSSHGALCQTRRTPIRLRFAATFLRLAAQTNRPIGSPRSGPQAYPGQRYDERKEREHRPGLLPRGRARRDRRLGSRRPRLRDRPRRQWRRVGLRLRRRAGPRGRRRRGRAHRRHAGPGRASRPAPRRRAVDRARGHQRGRVPPAAPRARGPGRRLDRRVGRGRRELHGRARAAGRDRRLGGAGGDLPAAQQARPGDVHRPRARSTASRRWCRPPAPTPSSATASSSPAS